jgi:heat-inducible transcriptional repressor
MSSMAQAQELDDRKAAIMRAIVSAYVRSGEPVGSKTLVERFNLGVSPATVRNEMAVLEDAGFIYQPHTSAGRVPTDAGYRFFVDAWTTHPRLPVPEAVRIHRFFEQPRYELEDALRKTASLLSRLTDHAAVVFAAALDRNVVRHVELVRLSGDKAMVLLVTDTGRVANHLVVIPESLDDVQLDQTAEMLNRIVVGAALEAAPETMAAILERFPLELRDAVATVARALQEELGERATERVFLEGTSNIVDEHKFADLETVRQVIGALEHRRLLLEVLAHGLASDRVAVRIGTENMLEEMQLCSIITAPYGAEGGVAGSLAVVGPTRMDYRRTVAAVHEVAVSLGQMLNDLGI